MAFYSPEIRFKALQRCAGDGTLTDVKSRVPLKRGFEMLSRGSLIAQRIRNHAGVIGKEGLGRSQLERLIGRLASLLIAAILVQSPSQGIARVDILADLEIGPGQFERPGQIPVLVRVD